MQCLSLIREYVAIILKKRGYSFLLLSELTPKHFHIFSNLKSSNRCVLREDVLRVSSARVYQQQFSGFLVNGEVGLLIIRGSGSSEVQQLHEAPDAIP